MIQLARLWFLVSGVIALVGLLGGAVNEVAASPAQSVDGSVCLDCHDMEDALSAAFPHAPVVERECSSCHNPHVARFASLLRERPAVLCVSCHADLAEGELGRVIHRPVAEGRCSECHQPHGGSRAGLLPKAPRELCGDCHGESIGWSDRPVQHAPFAQGKCSSCHDPHSGDFGGLASADGARLCTGCHAGGDALRAKHAGYPVEESPCTTCHDAHASARRGLLRENLHAPFEDEDCGECHRPSDSSQPFALVAETGELCGSCHGEVLEQSIGAPYPHVSAGGGACLECHSPHAGEGPGLLNGSMQSVCLSCHDPGGASSGEPYRFIGHGEGVTCSACHAPHGADHLVLLKADAITVCSECHSHQHSVNHPAGEEVLDPRSGMPMNCLSCHGIHRAGAEMYLHASSDGILCIGCHKDKGRESQ